MFEDDGLPVLAVANNEAYRNLNDCRLPRKRIFRLEKDI